MATTDSDGFLSRWSRRKVQAQRGEVLAEPPPPAPAPAPTPAPALAAAPQRSLPVPAAAPLTPHPAAEAEAAPAAAPPPPPPPPTLDDVARLPADAADFSRFVAPNVQADVKNAALKKLFTDPHFNVMDGLDIYIDDYSKPDPLPAGWLEKMALNQFVGLVTEPAEGPAPADGPAPAPVQAAPEPVEAAPLPAPDEDTHLQLQPDHGAGRAGAEPGAGPAAGRQH
jgi:hypothetical protein